MDHESSPSESSVSPEASLPQRRGPTARSENPEMWDLEREFERRRTEQLAEAWQKSARVVELMTRVQTLEPVTRELAERERELTTLREALGVLERAHRALEENRQVAIEAHRASEEARANVQAESERRLAEVERLGSEAVALRERIRQLEEILGDRQREKDALVAQSAQEREHASQQIERLERWLEESRVARDAVEKDGLAKLAQLQAELQERNHALEGTRHWAESTKAELEATRAQLAQRDATVVERDARVHQLSEEACALRAERDANAAALSTAQQDNRRLDEALNAALGQLEVRRTEREKHDGQLAATLTALTELRPKIRELEATLQSCTQDLVAEEPAQG